MQFAAEVENSPIPSQFKGPCDIWNNWVAIDILILPLAVQSIPILLHTDKLVLLYLKYPIIFIEQSRGLSARSIQLICLIHEASNKVISICIVSPLTWMDPDNDIYAWQKTLREIFEQLPCPVSMSNLIIWSLRLDWYKFFSRIFPIDLSEFADLSLYPDNSFMQVEQPKTLLYGFSWALSIVAPLLW